MRNTKQTSKKSYYYTTINGIVYKVIDGIRYTTRNRFAINNYGSGPTYINRII